MSRRTLNDALNSRIPSALNLVPTDPRVIQYINDATEDLLQRGHWVGTSEKSTVQVTGQLMTIPPQYATADQFAICNQPIPLRGQWFEFNPGGWGVINDPTPNATSPLWFSKNALRRNNACTFLDIQPGYPTQLVVSCDVAADVGTTVLIAGFDNATPPNWVRTQQGGTWADGELVTLAQSPGTTTTTTFSKIVGIQKPVTAGQLWIKQAINSTLIGNPQYWETNPSYARYLIPTLPLQTVQVDIMGKLAFRPVALPADWLIIGNLNALKLACMAKKWEEVGTGEAVGKAANYMGGALNILNNELGHNTGDGEQVTVRWSGMNPASGEPDPCLV
jgi:hypothetical protein